MSSKKKDKIYKIRQSMSSLRLRSVPTFNNLLIKTNKKNYNDETLKIYLNYSHFLKIETVDIKELDI